MEERRREGDWSISDFEIGDYIWTPVTCTARSTSNKHPQLRGVIMCMLSLTPLELSLLSSQYAIY